MIFYIFTFIVFLCSMYFFIMKQVIEEHIVRTNKSLGVTVNSEITREHKKSANRELRDFKDFLLYEHTAEGWQWKKIFYGILYFSYVILPLIGIYEHIGFHADRPLIVHFLSFPPGNFIEANLSNLTEIRVWTLMSVVHTLGLITAGSLSIRKLCLRYCTEKECDSHN